MGASTLPMEERMRRIQAVLHFMASAGKNIAQSLNELGFRRQTTGAKGEPDTSIAWLTGNPADDELSAQ